MTWPVWMTAGTALAVLALAHLLSGYRLDRPAGRALRPHHDARHRRTR